MPKGMRVPQAFVKQGTQRARCLEVRPRVENGHSFNVSKSQEAGVERRESALG